MGREIGREQATLTASSDARRIESTLTYTEHGRSRQLAATLETAPNGTPRHLAVRGERPREGRVDLDVTLAGGRAQVRDRGVTETIDIGARPAFPLDGAAPLALQESLVRYWRANGSPAEMPGAPSGPIHIERRATEQVDFNGRAMALERFSVNGAGFGRGTVWTEPGGTLVAVATWAGGLPLQAVREGYENRLDRFIEEALRDRLADALTITKATPPDYGQGIVLKGASVIVGGKKPSIPDATIVITGNRITAIGPSNKVKPPAEMQTLDVSGMTVVAGLIDVNGMFSQVDLAPVYLAAGVTTVLDATPDAAFVAAYEKSVVDDRLMAPSVLTGGFIDGAGGAGVTTATPDEGRQAVRKLRGDGAKRIEVGDAVADPVLRAIVQDANRLGLTTGSRAPAGVSAQDLVEGGLDRLESVPPGPLAALWPVMAKRRASLEPQLAFLELVAGIKPSAPSSIARAPQSLMRRYRSLVVDGTPGAGTPAAIAGALAAVREAQGAGIRVLAGTGPAMPAVAIHRELELLVQAGMSPADALQTATSIAAQSLNQSDIGTVEEGKRADLLILPASPLADIANLQRAKWIVAGGKVWAAEKLWKAAGF